MLVYRFMIGRGTATTNFWTNKHFLTGAVTNLIRETGEIWDSIKDNVVGYM
jgi:hypothetical protein